MLFVALVAALAMVQSVVIAAPVTTTDDVLILYDKAQESSDKPEIYSLSQLKRVRDACESAPKPDTLTKTIIRDSIRELVELVEFGQKQDMCSELSIKKVGGFYITYMYLSGGRNWWKDTLPRPVKRFFIAYALQVSETCKSKPLRELVADARKMIPDEDFEKVKKLTADAGKDGGVYKD